MEQTQDIRRYWVFQGMPDRYDLAEKLVPDGTESWLLSHSHQDINPGDVIYFWRGGRQAGVYGWGIVTDPPYEESPASKAKKPRWRVNTVYKVRFQAPILRDEITAARHGAQLAGLVILRAPQGTNFKVTTNEAINLNRLIDERSETAPSDPVGIETSRFPLNSIDPLSLGRSASTIIGGCLFYYPQIGGEDQLNGETLVTMLLTMAVSSRGQPRGTMPFLEKVFSSFDVPELYLASLDEPVLPLRRDPEGYFLSDEVLDILESARLFAIFSTRKEEIGIRHLLAGILVACRNRTLAQIESLAETAGISLRDLVQHFIDHTVSEFSRDDSSAWMSQFRAGVNARLDSFESRQVEKAEMTGVIQPVESEEIAGPVKLGKEEQESAAEIDEKAVSSAIEVAFFGRPVPDRPFGADLLRIDSEVAALAHLFALRDETGAETSDNDRSTFALGLFGRWGSGKSFFIEKLKAKIDKLRAGKGNGQAQYCQDIIQIDFNAWHYNEANIWASLVHHIFDSLQKHFERQSKDQQFRRLISELEISQERREQLNKQINTKEDQKQEIEDEIKWQETKIETIIDDQLACISELPARLAANENARDQLLGLLPQVAEILDLPAEKMQKQLAEGEKTASDVINIINEGGAALGQGRLLGRTVLRSGLTGVFIAFAGVVLLVYFAVPALLENANFWDEFLPIPGQIVALVTPALMWFRKRLTRATNLLNEIGSVETRLREDIRKQEEDKNEFLITLRTEQKRISDEVVDANKKKDLLDQEILDLKSKLDDLGSAESLVDYINDRASSDDYRSELGILALIRRDFERLFQLMSEPDQPSLTTSDDSQPQAEPREPSPAAGDDSEPQAELPHIDRIILYIDDLDRVQDSKKVLQVLEAVHLLLAFPLFHVVVAVDERWAARSVLSHHADFFGIKKVADNSNNNQATQDRASLLELIGAQPATPREFLEKIFQISFWVRPLTEQLTEGLIDGVVKKSLRAPVPPVTNSDGRSRNDDKWDSQTADAETANPEPAFEKQTAEAQVQPADHDAHLDTETEEDTDSPGISGESRVDEKNDKASFDTNFQITNEELISLRALGPVVGRSPRTVKRFINTYRLFKAMKIPPGEGGWTEDGTEEYDILEYHVPIMILLSIQVGYPDIAVRFFEHVDSALSRNDSSQLGALLEKWKASPPAKEVEKNKWIKAINALLSVHDLYGEKSRPADLTLDAFNPWLLATSRFGFQEWTPSKEL